MRRMGIDYRDASGAVTRRTIVVKKVQRVGDDALVTAWCEKRKALRTFRASRMTSLFDAKTGVIADPAAAFGLGRPRRSAPTSPFRPPSFLSRVRQRTAERMVEALAEAAVGFAFKHGPRLVAVAARKAGPMIGRWRTEAPAATKAMKERIAAAVPTKAALIDAVRMAAPITVAGVALKKAIRILPFGRG